VTIAQSTCLSADPQRQFEEYGYFFPVRVLDDRETKRSLDRVLESHNTHRCQGTEISTGSKANTSDVPCLAIRYVAAEVRHETPKRPLAVLARGRGRNGNFELQPAPNADPCP
jgi:hypothetical protein